MTEGQIIKALSGFYYVKTTQQIYTCKGRGLFRKQKITPLVGDHVVFDITENDEGYIKEIKPRLNEFVRPPIANITQAVIVSSATQPSFSALLLDRFIALMESKFIRPIIVVNKIDLVSEIELNEMITYKKDYEALGYKVFLLSLDREQSLPEIKDLFKGETTVIAGQTGVGKSTLLNVIDPRLDLKTGEISVSLGRGKHTTRHVEMIEINKGFVADTPGFSQLELSDIEEENLTDYFIEMKEMKANCRFRGCLHVKEPHCAIKKAVDEKKISSYRYQHYLTFLNEIKSRKPRY